MSEELAHAIDVASRADEQGPERVTADVESRQALAAKVPLNPDVLQGHGVVVLAPTIGDDRPIVLPMVGEPPSFSGSCRIGATVSSASAVA